MMGITEDARPLVSSTMPIVDPAPIPISQLARLHQSELRERWRRQLQAVGLKSRAKAGKPLVEVEVVTDLPRKARKLCGRVDSILGPVGKMNPEEASAYLHVLATHSDLVVSKVWEL
jgi:hypothetical protein